MSKPDIVPKQSVAGIAVDPQTLERIIPESKRPDGSVRKQLKVRPGFTPQEDIGRFRGSRQQQLDRNQLPKGHIIGWITPSSEIKKPGASGTSAATTSAGGGGMGAGVGGGGEKPMTKSAAKNAKRKAKKQAEKEKVIRESWDDSDEDKEKPTKTTTNASKEKVAALPEKSTNATAETTQTPATSKSEGDALAEELEKKLDVH